MTSPKQIDRKTFLTWTVSTAGATAFGCSADTADPVAMGGTTGVAGGGAGGTAAGAGGVAGMSGGGAGSASGGATGGGGAGGATGGGGAGGATGGGGAGGSGGGGAGGGGAGGGGAGGGGAGGAAQTGDCGEAGTAQALAVFISANHDHTMVVTMDDVNAGVTKSYDTTGTSGHPHWIELTAEDFAVLAQGGTVNKFSCNAQHEHEYIIKGMVGAMACESDEMDLNQECFAQGADMECGDVDGNFCP